MVCEQIFQKLELYLAFNNRKYDTLQLMVCINVFCSFVQCYINVTEYNWLSKITID